MSYLAFLLSIWAILLTFWGIVSVFKTTCSRQVYGAEGETISIFLRPDQKGFRISDLR